MRTLFWTLLLVIAAVAVALGLHVHPGNVVIVIEPWRMTASLSLVVVSLIVLFVLIYIVIRVLAWVTDVPGRVRAWRGRRAQARDYELYERGTVGLLEGRYEQAEKDFSKLVGQSKSQSRRALAALSAARCAHCLREFARRDDWLAQASQYAARDQALSEAVASVSGDMLLEQGLGQEALAVLEPLSAGGSRHLHGQRLLLRAHRLAGNHERVFVLTRSLSRRDALSKAEASALLDTSGAARLRAAPGDDWRAIWKDLKSEERTLPQLALAGAAAFANAGEHDEAARILEAAIAQNFDPRLLMAYAQCPPDQVRRRLDRAEVWLNTHPTDPDLLCTLGTLCLNGQLWGAAERYLLRASERRSDARIYALLGSLYDRLNRPQDAIRAWREATAVGVSLPELATDTALPAAETSADRQVFDAEGEDLDGGSVMAARDSVAQATGVRFDPSPYTASAVPPAHIIEMPQHDLSDDYFDSAPIPGLDTAPQADASPEADAPVIPPVPQDPPRR